MNYLKRSSAILIIVIFIAGCLSTSFANTIETDYFPHLLNKCLSSYARKVNSTQLVLNSKDYPQDNYRDCISYQASKTKKIIFPWIDLEEEDISSLLLDISREKGFPRKHSNSYFQVTIAVPKLPSIFLLESSFRL